MRINSQNQGSPSYSTNHGSCQAIRLELPLKAPGHTLCEKTDILSAMLYTSHCMYLGDVIYTKYKLQESANQGREW